MAAPPLRLPLLLELPELPISATTWCVIARYCSLRGRSPAVMLVATGLVMLKGHFGWY